MRKTRLVIIFLFIVSAFLFGGCGVTNNQETENEPEFQVSVNGQPVEAQEMFTLAQVAEHSSQDDCWLVIDGAVYDVTDRIDNHPGGEAILAGCGIDATELFRTRPMGSGTPHSKGAEDGLKDLYLGTLIQ